MPPENGGDLNYVISRLITRYVEYRGLSYDVITEVRGATEGSFHEFQIWVADPYERRKRAENGCVWGSLAEGSTSDTSR
jgi:hypothetical protein